MKIKLGHKKKYDAYRIFDCDAELVIALTEVNAIVIGDNQARVVRLHDLDQDTLILMIRRLWEIADPRRIEDAIESCL
jgi:hypothetical protein